MTVKATLLTLAAATTIAASTTFANDAAYIVKKVGKMNISAQSAAALDPNAAPRDGKTVYESVCTACHAGGLLGSPKFGDTAAWAPRIAKGKEALLASATNGLGNMPARGGGTMTDIELAAAVDYIISQSK